MTHDDGERRPTAATLYLPLAERGSTFVACTALLLVYAASMARDLSFFDSGELALAAVVLGLGHPPGQPLHTLLGFLFAHVPLWSPLVGVTLVSAIPGALSLIAATSLAQTLCGGASRTLARAVPWLLCALGLHASLWEPATRVEVYALATFFALWAVAKLAAGIDRKSLLAASIALGLSASANPITALCVGLALAPAVLACVLRGQLQKSALLVAIGGGLLGLLPYVYVPLAAQQSDVFVWGAPRDAESLWRYVSGQDFARSRAFDAATFFSHLGAWLWSTLERGVAPWLILGLVGHAKHARGRSAVGAWAAPIALLALAAVIASNSVWSLDVPDYDGYLAPAVWLAGAGAAALFSGLSLEPLRKRSAITLALALGASALIATPHVFERTRERDRVARLLAESVLRDAPPNAIVIAYSDSFAGPLYYLQEAERVRRDVVIVAYGLASSSWHWERVARRHPALQPFELRGAGGRQGRLRRFIAANAARPVLVESSALADMLGRKTCMHGAYFLAAEQCVPLEQKSRRPFGEELARALDRVGQGSPAASGAIAAVAYELGVSTWRAGSPRYAYELLLLGVPREHVPNGPTPRALGQLPPLSRALPPWRRHVALGDPARNLFVAALMLEGAGLSDRARALQEKAAQLGLPEAQ
jgi:hypothetical protein